MPFSMSRRTCLYTEIIPIIIRPDSVRTMSGMSECDRQRVAAGWLALVPIAQKSKEGGKGGRGVAVKAGWDGIGS